MDSLPFDLSSLSDDSQRLLCESLVARGHEVFESIAAAYLGKRQRPPVSITLRHSPLFNASAHVVGKHHFIDVNIATILLLQVLFQKLLSSSSVVPELSPSPDRMRNWKAPFIRDLGNSSVDAELEISLDPNRHSVAVVLQDFCAWFIVLHEISHLICGHCQGMRHFFGEPKMHEFFGIKLLLSRGRYLKTSWEYDADVTASAILSQYIHHFHTSKRNPELNAAFRFLDSNLAKLVGLVTSSLFAMFVYLSQMEYRLNVKSYHPHPMLRTKYIAQVLLRRTAADYGLDKDEIYEWQMDYMAQIAQEMDEIGLFEWDDFDVAFSNTDEEITRLSSIAGRLRGSCKDWSWFPIGRWEQMKA